MLERRGTVPSALALATLALATLIAHRAEAQESTAIDRFDPAPAGDDFAMVPSARVQGWLRPAFAFGVGYARAPLTLTDSSHKTVREVVAHHVAAYTLASLSFLERGLFEIELPATLHQSGEPVNARTTSYAVPSASALGDLRMSGRVELFEQKGALPSIALSGSVRLPTGNRDAYASTGNVRFTPRATLSADYGPVLWALGAWRSFEPTMTRNGDLLRDEVGAELGLAGRIAFAELGVEAVVATEVGSSAKYPLRSSVRFEPLASARAHAGPVVFTLAGGPGVARSPGTPAFRLFGSVGVAFDALPRKRRRFGEDDDASLEKPSIPSAPKRSTPPSTIGDDADRAPDRDHDKIPDSADACPDLAGVPQPAREKNGCPLDSDGDGFPDTEDGCPLEPGQDNVDPARRGCPSSVQVEKGRIVVLEKVQFATGKAELLRESDRVLDAARSALESDPTIVRVAVDGHTDGRGFAGANLALSRARAVAVVRWLTQHGIDARRLTARGFGPRQPIADDKTEEGRAKNRRVEFVILKRDPRGREAWTDGSVDEGTQEK